MEESQGETATVHFPEQMWEYHPSHGKDKSIHERVVKLLRNSGHEEQHRRPEWMAVQKDTDVYLETVETAKDAKTEADRTGNARMGSK